MIVFTEFGISETNMSEIVKRSGSSVGSVYHHFKCKEQLASAVYMDGIHDYQIGLTESLHSEEDAYSGIKSVITYHLQWVKNNPAWARFLFQNRHESFMADIDDEFNQLNKEFAQKIGAWFTKQINAGILKKLSWDIVIAILLGPCQEFARIYLTGKSVTPIKDTATELSHGAWNALAINQSKIN